MLMYLCFCFFYFYYYLIFLSFVCTDIYFTHKCIHIHIHIFIHFGKGRGFLQGSRTAMSGQFGSAVSGEGRWRTDSSVSGREDKRSGLSSAGQLSWPELNVGD